MTAMTADAVTVYWGHAGDIPAERVEAWLDEGESRRADGYRHSDQRRSFVVARGMLRGVLAERLAAEPERLRIEPDGRGKPRLVGQDLKFNLSHSADLVAVALSERREVGVDVERVRADGRTIQRVARALPPAAARGVERACEAERAGAFFRAWVRQEAYAKCRGDGLRAIRHPVDPRGWKIADLELPGRYIGAVALEGPGPTRVTMREFRLALPKRGGPATRE